MAAEVLAELKFRDGHREKIIVKVDNHLNSLIKGINQLNRSVSQLLSELVERENARGAFGDVENAYIFFSCLVIVCSQDTAGTAANRTQIRKRISLLLFNTEYIKSIRFTST
uniref:Uncharacterized protein n=1 Tax=Amphiprion ocellaris TaxID=80972 RepID=A0A3Q1BB88_AMPOC